MSAVILGIGLNVRVDFKGTPLESRAISIETATGISVDRAQLLARLLERVDYWSMRVEDRSLFEAWHSRLITLGRRITAHGEYGDLVGQAVDVDDNGTLLLRADDGTIHRIVAGEVTLSGWH
jgi:BirA family biotin operon repressor/biotin-[acetyl-CoA-carboxylase] ligase